MTSIDDPSIDSVKGLDDIIKNTTIEHNENVDLIETGSPTSSPLIRNENGNFVPSREVLKYMENISGINTSNIPQAISNEVNNIMKNLEEMCSDYRTSKVHCDLYKENMQQIFNLELDLAKTLRSKIRKDTALGIVENQQFSDMWGKRVKEKAKLNESVCYLCGLSIVPQGQPEMEHKIPSPVMFTTIMHYRQMTMFYAEDPRGNTKQESVYTRWHKFINSPDHYDNLLKLYNLINGASDDYSKTKIDNSFNVIFEAFLKTIPYIKDKGKGDFFKYLIKYWLLEFAYSHYICNRAKGDLPLCHETYNYYKTFSTSVTKRIGNYHKGSTDNRLNQECLMIRDNVVSNIKTREGRTCAMFAHMKETREKALEKYTTISEVFDGSGSCNGYQKMISVIVIRSMLALLKRNDVTLTHAAAMATSASSDIMAQPQSQSSIDSPPQSSDSPPQSSDSPLHKKAKTEDNESTDDNITEEYFNKMSELKIEIDELGDNINELKKGVTTRSGAKQAELEEKQAELEAKQAKLETFLKPIDAINDEQDNTLFDTIMNKLQDVTKSCVISGGKRGKTRRSMRKRRKTRRSSRGNKKTRKRKRKTVCKRRSK